ncbi:MAG: hypothetical protein KatS3mg081_1940 [Gemmatimonadales bacterium]|nr:MAG: hypothetical protein KatS3mg081_1940 [Gemmatimonadales bacterium]
MTNALKLEQLVASYLDVRWHLDPVEATAAGLREHDHRLGRFTPEDVRQHLAALRSLAGAVEQVEVDSLEDEIDRTMLLNELRMWEHRFKVEQVHIKNPGFWLGHALDGLYLLLSRSDRPLAHRAKCAASRLAEFPAFFRAARETLSGCPEVFVTMALRVAKGGRALLEQVSQELRPEGESDFDTKYRDAQEALDSFARFMEGELLDPANNSFAIGEDAFNFRLHYEHALRNTAPELWRYGNRLAEEIEQELARMAREIDSSARWPDLVDRLRAEHPRAEELVGAYASEMERARRFVEERDLVPIPPGPLKVVETPSFLRPLIPYAAYQAPGAFSPDRTGWFFVTPPDNSAPPEQVERLLRDHCVHEIASTALHEGYPGHHLQFLWAQQQERTVRKLLGTPLTIEGWALYCEEMMGEEGFYRGIEERFFQRVHLLWRALRIVLDVGLHTRGMSIEEAVNILVDRVHFERANAEAEVSRYCAYPAYQLCYAVGRRELRALRDAYRAVAGGSYSLRDFHEKVLSYGGLPVSLIRWGMGLEE